MTATLNADVVRAAMTRKRITSIQGLADLVGLSHSTVKRQMSGTDSPSLTFVLGVQRRLGLKFDRVLVIHDPEQVVKGQAA